MAEPTPRMFWPLVEENEDPWFESFRSFVRAQDASGFAAREDRNAILTGGGTLTWDAAGSGLTWTQPFLIWMPSTGFFTRLVAATLAPEDGQIIRSTLTRAPGQNVNAAAVVANIAENTDNSFVLGLRSGTNFVFRNGLTIKDGTTISAEDFFSGGGGGDENFSYKVIPVGESVTVPVNQQMVVSGGITVDGELILDGELALIPS